MQNLKRRKFLLGGIALAVGAAFGNLKSRVASACSIPGKQVELEVVNRVGGKPYVTRIDEDIAPIIKALQDSGVVTTSSCCGHGDQDGYIMLEDRVLIVSVEKGKDARNRYLTDFDYMSRNNARKRGDL